MSAFKILDAVIDRRDIGGRVIEATIALANDARLVRQFGNVAEENANRAFADLGDFRFQQPLDHRGQTIVVKAFAALDVVMDVENLVGRFEFLHRERDAFIPDAQIFLVAGLQLDQFVATCVAHRRIGFR